MITSLKTYPDRLALAVAAVSWVWMLGEAAVGRRISCCEPFPTTAADLTLWMVMVGAMMLPTTTCPLTAAEEFAAGASAIEQQAQQRRLAGFFRGGQKRDGALGQHAFPDPRDGLSLRLNAKVGVPDGTFVVGGHGRIPRCVGVCITRRRHATHLFDRNERYP
jgi:hypothetical protein